MQALKNTFTDNSLTRYYEERIKYLEDEKERLNNEARFNFKITLDFWIYAQRSVTTYVILHKESNHEFYADLIIMVLKMYESHDASALDTSINRLRIENITHCKEAIDKCQQITAAR
jgi:hypothetical protein